ncbi:GNAT family N-acetyltransferase [Streptomyces sp. NPDC014734]|uniref:GNAT family N-acetyltransferase n=1 Tax=Streptomyces sp. NPDC014734 TaxID=3364886 RepID=UPI0036FDF376
MFPSAIADLWLSPHSTGERLCGSGTVTVTVDPGLPENARLTVLTTTDGRTYVLLTPAVGAAMGLTAGQHLDETAFRRGLAASGIALHGADHLFYFTDAARQALLVEADAVAVRRLTADDAAAFADFQSSASEQDLEDSYVELDHWAVYGAFEGGRLVCAGSAYPWEDAPVADFGVLTLPAFRGNRHGRHVVRALARHAIARGHEPQYRCQLDNHASVALAASAGLTAFGTWDVVSPGSPA